MASSGKQWRTSTHEQLEASATAPRTSRALAPTPAALAPASAAASIAGVISTVAQSDLPVGTPPGPMPPNATFSAVRVSAPL